MKFILKMLARLYPSEWRRRYGAEYEALLEERTPRARDVFDVLWTAMKMQMTSRGFVTVVLPCALAGALVALAISLMAPPKYESQTTFMVTVPPNHDGECMGEKDLPPGLQGVTPVVCADGTTFKEYLKFASGDGFSREFLASLIQREGLYPRKRAHKPLDVAIGEMRRNIHVASPKQGSQRQFAIQFDYPDAHAAERVDDDLAGEVIVRVQNEQRAKFLQMNSMELRERLKFLRDRLLLTNSPSEARDLRSGIRQNLSLQSAVLHVRPLTAEALGLKAASFPRRPDGLSRRQLGMVGLVGGLLCGFMLAAVSGSRRDFTSFHR
jgi:hypothetical protein